MITALLTLAVLAEPSCRAHPWEVHAIVLEADRASRRHGVPVGLLVAVVLAESGGRNIISRRRKCGGRDVGVGQVHVHALHDQRRRIQQLLSLSVNVDESAHILARSRERCSRPRSGCRCLESHYNWRSTTWCGRVHRIWSRLMRRVWPGGVT